MQRALHHPSHWACNQQVVASIGNKVQTDASAAPRESFQMTEPEPIVARAGPPVVNASLLSDYCTVTGTLVASLVYP